MTLVSATLYGLLFVVAAWLTVLLAFRREPIGWILITAFWLRVAVALVLDSGLKYNFVLDSLAYEREAWLLAQSWATTDSQFYSLPDGWLGRNIYELLLASVFYLFGRDALLGELINVVVATLNIGLLYLLQSTFFPETQARARLITAVLLALYPSSMVWAATNIRDPLYFLFSSGVLFCGLMALTPNRNVPLVARVMALVGASLCFSVVLGLRDYIAYLFLGALSTGFVFATLSRRVRPLPLATGGLALLLLGALLWEQLAPASTHELLSDLQRVRRSFSNAGYDDFAQSSFALDYTFGSVLDLARFVPWSLLYYFFAPFPWAVKSTVQALSLVEVFAVYALVWPTYLGVRAAYQRARFQTVFLCGFVAVMATAQALAISNSGTIFRHRSLVFVVLLMFSGMGIHELWKKNSKAVL